MLKIELPQVVYRNNSSVLLYGGDYVVKQYTKSLLTPTWIYGEWVHGVIFDFMHFHPYAIIGGNSLNPNNPNWVTRKKDEEYLKKHGIQAKAIGAPICYLPKSSVNYDRVPDSLLVMPAHSSHYISSYNKNKNKSVLAYIDYIASVAGKFDHVTVCLHSECIKRNLWINEFREKGLEVIQGASTNDINSLERIRALMSQFEYVTSNVLGSHIAYASSFGAKVSIAGPYHEWHRETFLKEPFYAENEYLLDVLLNEEKIARESMPFLFVDPQAACLSEDWGKSLIGMDNVLAPEDLAKLLKINFINEVTHRAVSQAKNIVRPFFPNFLRRKSVKNY